MPFNLNPSPHNPNFEQLSLENIVEQDVFVKHQCPRSCHDFENCDLDI